MSSYFHGISHIGSASEAASSNYKPMVLHNRSDSSCANSPGNLIAKFICTRHNERHHRDVPKKSRFCGNRQEVSSRHAHESGLGSMGVNDCGYFRSIFVDGTVDAALTGSRIFSITDDLPFQIDADHHIGLEVTFEYGTWGNPNFVWIVVTPGADVSTGRSNHSLGI